MGSRRGVGEGSIFQRSSDGRWVATISYRDAAGKLHRPRRYGRTRVEARQLLRDLQRQAEAGAVLAGRSPTVAEYLGRWLNASRASVRPRTAAGYASIVAVRIVPRIGGVRLDRLTPDIIQTLYSDLADAGLSPRSVIHTHRCLHRALRQAVRWGLLGRNPTDAVDVPRAERREMTTLSREQVERLLAATVADRDHAIYVLAVTTGLRQGELLGLRWSDVDFDAGRLAVQRSLQRQQGKGLVFVEPKTARSRRSVTLSQRAVAALRDHRVRQLEERLALGSEWQDVSLDFPNLTGGPMDGPTLTGRFKAALVLAGLPVIRFHDLRHSAATLLLEEGIHPKVVQELLGHSTITLTLDTYSHVTATMHDQAATTMDRLFGS